MKIAEQAIFIDRGRSVWKGTIRQLKKEKKTMNRYLAV